MGKTQSREQEVYMVQRRSGLPQGYDLEATESRHRAAGYTTTTRPVLLTPGTVLAPIKPAVTRSQSWHALPRHQPNNMASRWKSAIVRKDILDRKASYLGKYRSKAVTENALGQLRSTIREVKQRKTRIKMTPSGLSYGSKPGGVLQTDKVPYTFVDMEDIESISLDVIARDVLLCVCRMAVVNSHGQREVAYEIIAFHMEPRDAMLFQKAFADFLNKGPLYQQMYGRNSTWQIKPTVDVDSVDNPVGWRTAATLSSSQSERDMRVVHRQSADLYSTKPVQRGYILEPMQRTRDYVDSHVTTTYEQDDDDDSLGRPSSKRSHRRPPSINQGTDVCFPGSGGTILAAEGHSLTRRVYFLDRIPMADVECQVKPQSKITIQNGVGGESRTSSRPTSRSSSRMAQPDDTVRRRIKDLSREMDKLKSMVHESNGDADSEHTLENHETIDHNSNTTTGSTYRENGPATRMRWPRGTDHAGTIDTRVGLLDVTVDDLPKDSSQRKRRPHQNGYATEPHRSSHYSDRTGGQHGASSRREVSSSSHYHQHTGEVRQVNTRPDPAIYTRVRARPSDVPTRANSNQNYVVQRM